MVTRYPPRVLDLKAPQKAMRQTECSLTSTELVIETDCTAYIDSILPVIHDHSEI